MPITGGTSDKLGNAYEGLWVFQALIDIVAGDASSIHIESIDEYESQGIEFILTRSQLTREYWSIKRQTSQTSGWTLNKLTRDAGNGRSILGDLIGHISTENTYAVFASMQDASDLRDLSLYASKGVLVERLERSDELKGKFNDCLLPIANNDMATAIFLLRHIKVNAVDEEYLRTTIDSLIKTLFYNARSRNIAPAAVRGVLSDFILSRIHQVVERSDILSTLESHGYRQWDLAHDQSVLESMETIKSQYINTIQRQLIDGQLFRLIDSETFCLKDTQFKRILIVGSAGSGKSSALLTVIQELNELNTPFLPIRFDELPDGILSATELGEKMGLPESPVLVLARIANGGPCALIIDQLDAISETSGRRTELWFLFEKLEQEINRFPNMRIIVGCRDFDLDNDRHLRCLMAKQSNYQLVQTKPLTDAQIDAILTGQGYNLSKITAGLRNLLRLPLHMSMYLEIGDPSGNWINSKDQLFANYWDAKLRSIRSKLGREPSWWEVIGALCNWFSDNQTLSAPKETLDRYEDTADAMTSAHVLILNENRYRFFHESFFDYAFARIFISSEKNTLLDML